ncbi:hypothetical protein V500_00913, partial [Pseudogymnoascus sp. VKM F-4518 (FW-2643)]
PRGPLPDHNVRMVVGRDQRSACVGDDVRDDGFALGGCGAAEEDAGAVGLGGGDFGGGGDAWHDDVGGDFEGGGGEGDGLGVVSWLVVSLDSREEELTTTMRHHPPLPPPSLLPALTLHQAQQRMERASRLERADFLEILALEPESDLGVCGGLPGPGGAFELGGGAGGGG